MKGFEFKVVFICGLNEGMKPDNKERDFKKIVYTGMIRAIDRLIVTLSGCNEMVHTIDKAYMNKYKKKLELYPRECLTCNNEELGLESKYCKICGIQL